MTEDFCRRQKMFSFGFNQRSSQYEIESREFKKVRDNFLMQLTNFGQPVIQVVDGNFENKSQLLLRHVPDGRDLRGDYAEATLRNLYKIWTRPVFIDTVVEQKSVIWGFDGKEFNRRETST